MAILDDLRNTFSVGGRLAQTSFVLLRHADFFAHIAEDPLSQKSAHALREIFEALGATYIKLGQFIASAPGIFPDTYVTEMQACLDQTSPLDFDEIEPVLRSELGSNYLSFFREIEKIPLASASIAQVHAATLNTGESVVLKIQRPGIENKLFADLGLMAFAARLFELILPEAKRSGVTDLIRELGKSMSEETDFLKEAKNITDFEEFLTRLDEPDVVVPRVVKQLSTGRVLTMSRLHGASLTDLRVVKKYARNPKAALEKALSVWFRSLALVGFFHADVHAGNLMILEDGKIGFIDFGIVGRFSPKIFDSLWLLVQGFTEKNYRLIARSLIGLDATGGSGQKVDEEKFANQLATLFASMEKMGVDFEQSISDETVVAVNEIELNDMILKLVSIARDNGLRIPREFALLIKQFLYFDRYAQILAPGMSVYQEKFLPRG